MWSLQELVAYEGGRNESCDYMCVILAKLVGQDLYYYYLFIFCVFMDRDKVEVHQKLKK